MKTQYVIFDARNRICGRRRCRRDEVGSFVPVGGRAVPAGKFRASQLKVYKTRKAWRAQ
jgi:hypothetical protein